MESLLFIFPTLQFHLPSKIRENVCTDKPPLNSSGKQVLIVRLTEQFRPRSWRLWIRSRISFNSNHNKVIFLFVGKLRIPEMERFLNCPTASAALCYNNHHVRLMLRVLKNKSLPFNWRRVVTSAWYYIRYQILLIFVDFYMTSFSCQLQFTQ